MHQFKFIFQFNFKIIAYIVCSPKIIYYTICLKIKIGG
jgi:hypothetical protein